ncbi:hypothetical protein [Serratia fonticola]|uniref:hypothetical protein n=1 Tax=Serratia fonticola TaxID=47917 RepID=UPI003BB68A00
MKTKDEREWEVLDNVFDLSDKIVSVIKSEQPDFILDYKGIMTGVEITELYYNHSMARIHNKKNYVEDILVKGKIHKDDKNILIPWNVIYYGKSMGYKPSKIKILPNPAYDMNDFRESFISAIDNKEISKKKYNETLEQCSLITFDKENAFKKIDAADFHSSFINERVFDSIMSSSFDEIFILVMLKNNKIAFSNLKLACLLLEMNRLFNYIAKNKDKFDYETLSKATSQIVFAEALLRRGVKDISMFNMDNFSVTSTPRYGIGFNDEENNHTCIIDHFPELHKSNKLVLLEELPYHLFNEDSFRGYRDEVKNNGVSFNIPFLNKKYGYQFYQ